MREFCKEIRRPASDKKKGNGLRNEIVWDINGGVGCKLDEPCLLKRWGDRAGQEKSL